MGHLDLAVTKIKSREIEPDFLQKVHIYSPSKRESISQEAQLVQSQAACEGGCRCLHMVPFLSNVNRSLPQT